jgi:hypothetical protein
VTIHTIAGRVNQVSFPPGQPEAYVGVVVEGDTAGNGAPNTRYVTGGTQVSCDGVHVNGVELAEWLANNRCGVSLRIDVAIYY